MTRVRVSILSAILSIAAGAVLAVPLGAVIMRALSLGELVEGSSRIVVATVVSNESRWDDERARIYTYTTIRVEEHLKGSGAAGDTLVIRTLGGAVGEIGLHIEGAPVFRPQDREVLFLSPIGGRPELNVTGWNQGRFGFRTDPRTGQELVGRSLTGVLLAEPPAEGVAAEFKAIRTLDDLRRALRSQSGKEE